MTRYRLPESLGGGEVEANGRIADQVFGDHPAMVIAVVDGVGVWIPKELLTELKPPLPPEPPAGSVVLDAEGRAWQRPAGQEHKSWWCAVEAIDQDWAELNGSHGPLTLLVPDPFAEPVQLPWRWEDSDLTVDVPPKRTHVNVRAGHHGCNIQKAAAREMARALWSAANAAEAAP